MGRSKSQLFKREWRQKMVADGADEAERLHLAGYRTYQVPTNDPYLAQSIAVVLRNRGYPARAEGHVVTFQGWAT